MQIQDSVTDSPKPIKKKCHKLNLKLAPFTASYKNHKTQYVHFFPDDGCVIGSFLRQRQINRKERRVQSPG